MHVPHIVGWILIILLGGYNPYTHHGNQIFFIIEANSFECSLERSTVKIQTAICN